MRKLLVLLLLLFSIHSSSADDIFNKGLYVCDSSAANCVRAKQMNIGSPVDNGDGSATINIDGSAYGWKRVGTNVVLTNSGDNVGIGSSLPQAGLVVGNGGSPTYPSITNTNDAFIRGDVEIDGNLYVDGLIYGNQLILPYGEYSSNITQVVGATTLSYAVTFDSNDIQQNITHAANDSKIYIKEAGTYLITFSAIGKSTIANKSLDIWLSVDGVNVPASNTLSKFVGAGNERIITVTYIYEFTAGQYFELKYHADDTGVTLAYTAAASTPTRPASPSVILTINKISR